MTSESISLKKDQQSSFDIAVKRLRSKVKDGDIGLQGDNSQNRGIVRLSRIPHGFYEEEMRRYFSQFGVVTRIRLARSKKTGNSRGFAFIEFKVPEVAKVVAETMNNYLMFDKILKAKYIPPEEQAVNYFIGVSKNKVPRVENRKIAIALHNRKLAKKDGENFYRRIARNLNKQLKKIKELGIEYDFKPVNISKAKKEKAILTLDESDEEITFKIPRNVEVVKKEVATDSSSKKFAGVCFNVVKKGMNSKEDTSAESNLDCQNQPKSKKRVTLSKPVEWKSSTLGRGCLRGIKKPKSLKVPLKVKLNDMKKTKNALKLSLAEVNSPGTLTSLWQVKESI